MRLRDAAYLVLIASVLLTWLGNSVVAGILTLLGTVILYREDIQRSKLNDWPHIAKKEQEILARYFDGAFQGISVWHHSETKAAQFAMDVADIFGRAGIPVTMMSGFSAPSTGIRIQHRATVQPNLVISAFRLIGITVEIDSTPLALEARMTCYF
jgi:hypothetical protein